MPCLHRFHKELLPLGGINFLFIGTFNPIWVVKKGDNPDYFYSRAASEFWCILPHAFNANCLVDKNRVEKEEFCVTHRIGLTDLIYCINNAEENDEEHKKYLIKGFKDEDFEKIKNGNPVLDIHFFSPELKQYIRKNVQTLKGVFFTRKSKKDIPRLWAEWDDIKSLCISLNIYCKELASPSPRGGRN